MSQEIVAVSVARIGLQDFLQVGAIVVEFEDGSSDVIALNRLPIPSLQSLEDKDDLFITGFYCCVGQPLEIYYMFSCGIIYWSSGVKISEIKVPFSG
ncbi:hypothetical protein D6821_00315 [Candidatus Parcubacteria bacterium]|nr:MAG: hypothetical protein D6821_00315 [Candidatus Parcubacteria bacterium]